MVRTLKIIGILILALSTSACQNVPVWKYSMFEKPAGNYNYPPLYIQGWKDGCESGAQASSNSFYRAQYKFKQNWELITDPVYKNGWDSAYNQCRKYILQHNMNEEQSVETSNNEEENLWTWR
jgi:hypothetical protein